MSQDSSHIPITYEKLHELSEEIPSQYLGYAIRIIGYMHHCGNGIPLHIAAKHFGIQEKTWKKVYSSLIEKHFEIKEERLFWKDFPEKKAPQKPEDSSKQSQKTDRKLEKKLPLLFSENFGANIKPDPISPHKEEPKSISQNTFEVGIRLLTSTGKSEATARACLAKLLKKYDIGSVAGALNITWQKRDTIADPYSYLLRIIKKYPEKEIETSHFTQRKTQQEKIYRPEVSKEFVGMSDSFAKKIEETNKKSYQFDYED